MLYRNCLVLLCFWGMVTAAIADIPVDVYPGSKIVKNEVLKDTEYAIALGSITRTGGRWQPQTSRRLQGDLNRITLEVPEGHSLEEAYQFYRNGWSALTRGVLFDCQGRGCGSSSFWANSVFGVRELSAPDENQRYTAFELSVNGRPVYATLYSVQRVNRRVYIHIDWLVASQQVDGDALAISNLLADGRPGILLRQENGWRPASLDAVAELLKSNTDISLYVVGHAYNDADLASALGKAKEHAEAVATELRNRGVKAEQLSVQSVGPLAPAGIAKQDRVVLVPR